MRTLLAMTLTMCCLAVAPASGQSSVPAGNTFTGTITDSLCGRDGHAEAMRMSKSMGDTSASCAVACVRQGAKFVLLDSSGKKLYGLSDQSAAAKYAGQEVKVTGSLTKSMIHVTGIEPQATEPDRLRK